MFTSIGKRTLFAWYFSKSLIFLFYKLHFLIVLQYQNSESSTIIVLENQIKIDEMKLNLLVN